MEDYADYQSPQVETETQSPQSQLPVTEPVLTYPSKKTKRITMLEKVIFSGVIIAFLVAAVFTIRLATGINQLEREIISIEQGNAEKQDQTNELEQEKSELSRADRIKKAAEDAGLKVNDENIRNVKK